MEDADAEIKQLEKEAKEQQNKDDIYNNSVIDKTKKNEEGEEGGAGEE